MEVMVQRLEGIEAGSIVSIRAGATRRQAAAPLDQPLAFPMLPFNAGSLKVDLLKPIASCRVDIGAAADAYPVVFPANETGGGHIALELAVKEAPHLCGSGGQGGRDLADDKDKQANAEDAARAYLEKFRLMGFVGELLQYIIREQPEDPYAFMAAYLRRINAQRQAPPSRAATPAEAPPPFEPTSPSAAIWRQNERLDAENERLRQEIVKLKEFCDDQGLPIVGPDSSLDLDLAAALAAATCTSSVDADASGRNQTLRDEHEELRKTLETFCKGFADLSNRLNTAVALALPQGENEDVLDVEMETAMENTRLEMANQEMMKEIKKLEEQLRSEEGGDTGS